jgi:hypothetical protein
MLNEAMKTGVQTIDLPAGKFEAGSSVNLKRGFIVRRVEITAFQLDDPRGEADPLLRNAAAAIQLGGVAAFPTGVVLRLLNQYTNNGYQGNFLRPGYVADDKAAVAIDPGLAVIRFTDLVIYPDRERNYSIRVSGRLEVTSEGGVVNPGKPEGK